MKTKKVKHKTELVVSETNPNPCRECFWRPGKGLQHSGWCYWWYTEPNNEHCYWQKIEGQNKEKK